MDLFYLILFFFLSKYIIGKVCKYLERIITK